jgi:hypothetical protein
MEMSINRYGLTVMLALLAGSLPLQAGAATAPQPPAPALAPEAPLPDREALEAELTQARAELDAAASRLAELHKQLYAVETVGQPGQKPMLGVLLGERGPNGGLMLVGVTPGGGAEAAGLKTGDELMVVNGSDLAGSDRAMHTLKDAMQSVAPGDLVTVTYNREGGVMVADITTQARGVYFMGMTGMPDVDMGKVSVMTAGAASFGGDPQWIESLDALENLESLEQLDTQGDAPAVFHQAIRIGGPGGLRLEDISADLGRYFGVESGVLVMDTPQMPDGKPILKAGDILLAVDGAAISNAGQGYEALFEAPSEEDPSPSRTVEVLRDGLRETLTLPAHYPAGSVQGITVRKAGAGNVDVRVIRSGPS